MANKLTPPQPTGIGPLDRWLNLLWRYLTLDGQIDWGIINFSGSNITDIETRNHNDTQNIQGGASGQYYHLTSSEYTNLDSKIPKTGIGSNADGSYDTTLTYNETTRTVTIAPTGASFDVFIRGVKYTKTSESLAHPATGTGHFFYYDATGTLVTATTPWDLLQHAPVCFVFQDVTNNRRIPFEERHHAGRDVWWHLNQHFNEGTKSPSGFTASSITGYTLSTGTDAACTFALASGRLEDEDIRVDTEALPDAGPYVILERVGTGAWEITRTSTIPFFRSGTVLQYNQNNAGTWQRTNVANGDHVNYYVYGVTALPVASITPTPSATQQIIIIPGQAKFTNLAGANAETIASIQWGTIPFQEIVPLYKLTYKYSSAAGGTVSLEDVVRVVGTAATISAATVTDHGSLTGLTDDDHTQYLLASAATDRSTFATNWTDITDGNSSNLHYHESDRDSANHPFKRHFMLMG